MMTERADRPIPGDAIDDARTDVVVRPRAVWWILTWGGIGFLAVVGLGPDLYAWWTGRVSPLPPRLWMAWAFVACVAVHAFEAVYVFRLARRAGLTRSAAGWALQTMLLGYPSTSLLKKRAKRSMSATR